MHIPATTTAEPDEPSGSTGECESQCPAASSSLQVLQPEVQGALLAPRGNGLSAKRSESSTRRAQGAQAPTAAVLKSRQRKAIALLLSKRGIFNIHLFLKGLNILSPAMHYEKDLSTYEQNIQKKSAAFI